MKTTETQILSAGEQGPSGPGILSGAGVPTGNALAIAAADGNFYLDTTASRLYGPKTAGAWGAGVSLIGPAGSDGSDGSDATVTTANILAALLASPPDNAGRQALAIALGYQLFATRLLANGSLAPGTPYFNTTSFTYDVTTA